MANQDIKYLDIEIVNSSNKSIDFDVEMKLFKEEDFALISEYDLKREIKQNKSQTRLNTFISQLNFEVTEPKNLLINITENDEEIIICRTLIRNRTTVTLAQNSHEKDIFCQSIIILQNKSNFVCGTLTIRCDEFIEGALVKDIIFET